MDYCITYRVGEGKKDRTLVIKNANSKQDASVRFQNQGPENSYIVQISNYEEIQKKNRTERKMLIHNSFDEYLLKVLQERNLHNQDLIDHLKTSRKTWPKMRKHPETLTLYDLILISEFLSVSLDELLSEARKVVLENRDNDSIAITRSRS